MASIEDPVARARVIELDGQAALALNRVAEREGELAGLRERQAQLQRRLVNEQNGRPDDRTSDELAEALIADPDAELSTTARTALRSARDKSARVVADHEAITSVTATAIAKIDDLIVEAEAALEDDRATAAQAWSAFVLGAYDALLNELRENFQYLTEGPLGALIALAEAQDLYSGARVIPGSHPKLTAESKMVLRGYGVPITTQTWFDPGAGHGQPGSIDRSGVLQTFRARLCADALAPAN